MNIILRLLKAFDFVAVVVNVVVVSLIVITGHIIYLFVVIRSEAPEGYS